METLNEQTQLIVFKNFIDLERYNELEKRHDVLFETYIQLQKSKDLLSQKVIKFERERGQIYKDASLLYKRGILELQLQLFLSMHSKTDEHFFVCADGGTYACNFSSAMRHWRTCPMHDVAPVIRTEMRDSLVCIQANENSVMSSTDNLYSTLSQQIHFNPGESYPIRISQFDRLALLSFFDFYEVPYFVERYNPIPQSTYP